jgi:hypothetical protein
MQAYYNVVIYSSQKVEGQASGVPILTNPSFLNLEKYILRHFQNQGHSHDAPPGWRMR